MAINLYLQDMLPWFNLTIRQTLDIKFLIYFLSNCVGNSGFSGKFIIIDNLAKLGLARHPEEKNVFLGPLE